jgi:hypothetical protein
VTNIRGPTRTGLSTNLTILSPLSKAATGDGTDIVVDRELLREMLTVPGLTIEFRQEATELN